MQTGEYKFNDVECIEINKSLMDGLYAPDLELFQLVVTFQCNKEFNLL